MTSSSEIRPVINVSSAYLTITYFDELLQSAVYIIKRTVDKAQPEVPPY